MGGGPEECWSQTDHRWETLSNTALAQVGDPLTAQAVNGPVISRQHREKIASYVALAREEGGEILWCVALRSFFLEFVLFLCLCFRSFFLIFPSPVEGCMDQRSIDSFVRFAAEEDPPLLLTNVLPTVTQKRRGGAAIDPFIFKKNRLFFRPDCHRRSSTHGKHCVEGSWHNVVNSYTCSRAMPMCVRACSYIINGLVYWTSYNIYDNTWTHVMD